jgi:ataxin-3
LNALLQGSYFTPVDLAILAQQMDDEERLRMAESGIDSEDYRRFLEVTILLNLCLP